MIARLFKKFKPLSFISAINIYNNIKVVDTVTPYLGGRYPQTKNAHFLSPVISLCLPMFLTRNLLLKGKTEATIEFSGQFGLYDRKFEPIRTKPFFTSWPVLNPI